LDQHWKKSIVKTSSIVNNVTEDEIEQPKSGKSEPTEIDHSTNLNEKENSGDNFSRKLKRLHFIS